VTIDAESANSHLQDLLAFPDNVPNLAAKRPPQGNVKPQGILECAFEQRRQGKIPPVY
jgi:hypothetical protein